LYEVVATSHGVRAKFFTDSDNCFEMAARQRLLMTRF
jgi:hypothetical protein